MSTACSPSVPTCCDRGPRIAPGSCTRRISPARRAGAVASAGVHPEVVSIVDVAPTALHLLGEPVFAEMSGTVPPWLFEHERPVLEVSESDDPRAQARPGGEHSRFDPRELEELEARLRATGYGN